MEEASKVYRYSNFHRFFLFLIVVMLGMYFYFVGGAILESMPDKNLFIGFLTILFAVILSVLTWACRQYAQAPWDLTLTLEGIRYEYFRKQIGTDFIPWREITSCWESRDNLFLDIKESAFRAGLKNKEGEAWNDVVVIPFRALALDGTLYSNISDGIYGRLKFENDAAGKTQ